MKNETLDLKDPQVIEDAVKLSKQQFVEMYTELGYNKVMLGVNWGQARDSQAGKNLLSKFTEANGPVSQISLMDEEVAERKGVVVEKKGTKKQPLSNETKTKRGDKGETAKKFIAEGVRSVKELSEKANISPVYAGRLLEKAGFKNAKVPANE